MVLAVRIVTRTCLLLGRSELDDDLDVVDSGNGIWERRRSGVTRGKKLLKSKEKVKAKQCKSIIVEDDKDLPPPASHKLDK